MLASRLESPGLLIACHNGAVALIGTSLNFARCSNTPDPHVTLLSAAEYKSLGRPDILLLKIPRDHVYVLGPAGKGEVKWLVVVWNHANIWRKQQGLGAKQFHITLSASNNHHAQKGIESLQISAEELVNNVQGLGVDGMDHVVVAAGSIPTVCLALYSQQS